MSAPLTNSNVPKLDTSRVGASRLIREFNPPPASNPSNGMGESDVATGICPLSAYSAIATGRINRPTIKPIRNFISQSPFRARHPVRGDASLTRILPLPCAVTDAKTTQHAIRHAVILSGVAARFPFRASGFVACGLPIDERTIRLDFPEAFIHVSK